MSNRNIISSTGFCSVLFMARLVLTLPVLAMLHVSVHPLLLSSYHNGHANCVMLMVVNVFRCMCVFFFVCVSRATLYHPYDP